MYEKKGFTDAHMHISSVIMSGGYPDMDYADRLFTCAAEESQWDDQITAA
jgi:hypothetical protein